jgi:tetratricopeptide (TPR) repeat protein
VARWLRAWAGLRIDEFSEIEAYHLEQAVLIRRELGMDADSEEISSAVGALLASAQKAAARDDRRAVVTFVERALVLDEDSLRDSLEAKAVYMDALLALGQNTRVLPLAAELEDAAHAAAQPVLEARAIRAKAFAIWISPDSADAEKGITELKRARALLEAARDWPLLLEVLEGIGYEGWWHGQLDQSLSAWTEMAEIARREGMPAYEAQALMLLSKVVGMRGQNEERFRLLARARELAELSGSRLIRARVERTLGTNVSLIISHDEGRHLLTKAGDVLEELGDTEEFSIAQTFLGDVALRMEDLDLAMEHYQRGIAAVADHIGYRPEFKRRIASVLLREGKVEEAAVVAEEALEEAAKDDWATVAVTNTILGTVREAQGRLVEAERLLRRGVEVIETTEYPGYEQYLGLATLLAHTGRADEARDLLVKARESGLEFSEGSPMELWIEHRAAALEREMTKASVDGDA